jgi:hypothetical protein
MAMMQMLVTSARDIRYVSKSRKNVDKRIGLRQGTAKVSRLSCMRSLCFLDFPVLHTLLCHSKRPGVVSQPWTASLCHLRFSAICWPGTCVCPVV